ncbi:MAG: EAL domain-containing protein [Aeromonadaceae bacterium]|nr:EAL domain-containing protein [Aeromonadaceae bacterium]
MPSYLSSGSLSVVDPAVKANQVSAVGHVEGDHPDEIGEYFQQLCLLAQQILPYPSISIWLQDASQQQIVCSHALGPKTRLGRIHPVDEIRQLWDELAGAEILNIVNAQQDPRCSLRFLDDEPTDLLLAAIKSHGQQVGALVCRRPSQFEPWPEHCHAILRTFSLMAGRGLENLDSAGGRLLAYQRQQQLERIHHALAAKTGRPFFDELVSQLRLVLQAQQVWVCEAEQTPAGPYARMLAESDGFNDGSSSYRYALHTAACRRVYEAPELPYLVLSEVLNLPSRYCGAAYYCGVALRDTKRKVIGHLAMTFERLPDESMLQSLLNLVCQRAGGELERQQAEAQLRLSAVAFETNEGLIITDPELVILRVNHAFTQITGLSPREVVGKRLGEELWPWPADLAPQFDEAGRWEGEVERWRREGIAYPQWETWTPVRDEEQQITHYVICFEDLSERQASARQIQSLAYFDDLTGLPNRRLLLEQVERAFVAARESEWVGALLFIDLDHFKTINDSLGHAAGDWLLQQVAKRLQAEVGPGDVLARLGGDEFVLLLPTLSESPPLAEMQASGLGERLIELLSEPYQYQGLDLHIAASIGVTLFPSREQQPEDLLKQADTAMYQAKAAGRRTIKLFDAGMQRQADRRLLIHNQLRHALGNNELLLHYQPQHMVDSGDLIGVEALLRWHPPGHSMISPAEFIPIAEETDLIIDIGQWVLLEACHQFVRWEEEGVRLPQLSVNVSAKQFHHQRFVEHIHEVLSATGMEPSALNLEITESVVLGNTEDAIHKMSELKQLGINFSIDDFGTGYSSLGYLKRLPVDELKIDRSFIQDIPHDVSNMAIVEAVMAMARHLGFNVTAEGVETRQQLEFLRKQNCSFYQGFLASKPLPAEHMQRYALRHLPAESPSDETG